MDSDTEPRRQVLKYIGAGAVAGSAGLFGLHQLTQTASAQVALAFEDTTVDLPDDDAIDDLRITGDVSGDFETGAGPSETVMLDLDVEFDRFGDFSDSMNRHPDEPRGSVRWQPTYSLVDQTEFTGAGDDLQSASFDNNTVSYDVTAGVEIEVYADGSLVAEAQDAATGTITFRDPQETRTDDETQAEDESEDEDTPTAGASVDVSFEFEVQE
ncbi:hypothetical protein [Halodesulfurarchaeum formicicum]|uniref:hypothetical protein n=1 Tax=Halodesulfurarchaeum formicicum TaxID=1873524 RepID=UPI00090322CE|nr:hypothetical protein [Halodesulfurarchaeum formicicum]